VQPEWQLDGVNLLPYLTGEATGMPHDALFWRLGEHMAVRKGEWKLVHSPEGPLRDVDHSVPRDLSGAQLFNLETDIGESNNLAAQHADKVKELAALWLEWNAQLTKPLWGIGRVPAQFQ
jgi:arylsulfatase A-like enzyme